MVIYGVPVNIKKSYQIIIASIIVSIIITSVISGSYFAVATQDISSEIILQTSKTVIGQDIQYPTQSHPEIISKIVTIPVGVQTVEHVHEYPLYAHIMEGNIRVEYNEIGGQKSHVFGPGDTFIEAINVIHKGINIGDIDAKILTVSIGD